MGCKCLKCGYERVPTDDAPDHSCPKCGAVYAKVEAKLKQTHYEYANVTSARANNAEIEKQNNTSIKNEFDKYERDGSFDDPRKEGGILRFFSRSTPFQIILSICALLLAIGLLYYFIVAAPEARREQLAIQKKIEDNRASMLLDCRVNVENERNAYLHRFGSPIPNSDKYLLPPYHIEKMNEIQRKGDAECYRTYGG